MKRSIFIITLLCILTNVNVFSIKFKIPNKDKAKEQLIILATIDTGFSVVGVTDGLGITDYQSFFFRTAFQIQEFAIGFDFNIRFKIFTMEPEFKVSDWTIADNPLMTFFLYMDKIDYIRYGNMNYPIYFTTGNVPYTTFGTGMLVNNFHNRHFDPIDKENGFYTRFNGNFLSKLNGFNVPVTATFFCEDLLDPDIFATNIYVEPLRFFASIPESFHLSTEIAFACDLDATESNRLSAMDKEHIDNFRNAQKSNWDASVIGLSVPIQFSYNFKEKIKIIAKEEFLFLFKNSDANTRTGFINNFEIDTRSVYINKSGYLIGASIGFIARTNNCPISVFSSNYQIMRQLQYLDDAQESDFVLSAGIGLFAFDENLQFKIKAYFYMNKIYYNEETPSFSNFHAKFDMMFRLSDIVVKGLTIDTFYETSMTKMEVKDSKGGFFLRSLTRNFRLYANISYQIYSAKIKFVIGLQSPAWIKDTDYIEYSNNILSFNSSYGSDLQKFVGVEVSFVL